MLRSKKLLMLVSFLLVLSLVIVGCGGDTASGPADPNRLVVAQMSDAVTLDPHGQNDNASSRIRSQMFETLVEQDENLEIIPGLAKNWEQLDELTYEFYLKEGVKFHNGEELTADDVAFSLRRALNSANVSFIIAAIDVDSIKVVDTYTVRFSTEIPFAPILAHLAHSSIAIVSEKAVNEFGSDFGENPIGTGPYKLVNWQKDEFVELVRFEDYHNEERMAKIETLVIRTISEGGNRTIELETGGVHIAYDIPATDVDRVETSAELNLIRDMNFSTTYVGFNTAKKPFDDVRVRQAINYAIDMDAIVGAAFDGIGSPSTGPLGSNVWGANLDLEEYGYDVEKAKKLLAEAGYSDGFEAKIWTNDRPERVAVLEMVQHQLKQVGIELETSVIDWGVFLQETAAGNHDMIVLGWVTVTGDPDYGLYALFHSSAFGDPGNRTFYKNPRVDELLDLGRTTPAPDERAAYYYEVQEIIREDAPWIFTWTGEELTGTQNYVRGFVNNPAGHHPLWTVYFQ